MFSVAHLSDLHATPVRPDGLRSLLNKRFFGWLSWNTGRKQVYRNDILAALIDDLRETKPDQIVVTGDLTNIGLESEFEAARSWLERIGDPDRVFAIPGNHDAYVAIDRDRSLAHWAEYLESDASAGAAVAGVPGDVEYPTVRRRGPVAFVGVCSALPTPLFKAGGTVGAAQLERLEALLTELDDSDVCRVVLIHHPVTDGATSQRRSLSDADAFRAVLRRAGADLVLHGHNHRSQFFQVPGPDGPIPVVGVRSASNCGKNPDKLARYHLYDVTPAPRDVPGPRFRVSVRVRGYVSENRRFVHEGERLL
jgi:3',5'-cyclic AMP phosphodiesterase CpdA